MAKATSRTHYMTGPKKGQFKPKSARGGGTKRKRKAAAPRKAAPRRRSQPRRNASRRSYRRNPARPDVVKMLTRGGLTATQVLLGKAATRAIPDVANLPKGGNTGLAVEVAVALALGYVSEMFFTKTTAAAILAGGLTSPVERLIAQAGIPYISEYLTETGPGVAGYVQPRTLSGYVQPSYPTPLAGYGRGGGAQGEDYTTPWM